MKQKTPKELHLPTLPRSLIFVKGFHSCKDVTRFFFLLMKFSLLPVLLLLSCRY